MDVDLLENFVIAKHRLNDSRKLLINVTVDYLVNGPDASSLTPKDNRDIAKDLNNIMEKLTAGEDGPASYNGEELSPDAAELFRDELEIALKRLKIINKEKYTPKKYKK